MKTINIETIEFPTGAEASENKNYPHSGLFIARTKDGSSDLRLIDKTIKTNFCIVPESVFNGIFENVAVNKPVELESVIQSNNKYEGDFILEFARILLNRK